MYKFFDAILTAKESFVTPRAELAIKSINAFSGEKMDGEVKNTS